MFVLRIKRDLNRPPPTPIRTQTQVPTTPINQIITFNQPPHNPYPIIPIMPPQPRPDGRIKLQPIGGVQVQVIERRHVSREIIVRHSGPMNSVEHPLDKDDYY